MVLIDEERHLWVMLGGVLCPMSGPHISGVASGVMHAVSVEAWPASKKARRRTVDTVCGRRAKLAAVEQMQRAAIAGIVVAERAIRVAVPWPSRAAALKDQSLTRCAECFELTGKPRPYGRPKKGNDDG